MPTTTTPTARAPTVTSAVPTRGPTANPTATPDVVAPPSLTVVDPVRVLQSVPFEGPFLTPNTTLTTTWRMPYPSDDSMTVSSVIDIVLTLDGVEVPVSSLQEPIEFILNITNITQLTHTTCVADGQATTVSVLPECVFWDKPKRVWSSAGCSTSNVTPTTVTCQCSHLTEFAIARLSFNELGQAEVRGLGDLHRFPTTGIVLLLVLLTFGCASVGAGCVDSYKDSAEKKEAKRKRWQQQQGQTPDFVRVLKAAFQNNHPWFAVYFRQSGSSFLSADRCLALLVLVLCNMATAASFWSRPSNEFLVRFVVSSLISFVTYEVLEQLFSRCGPPGFREQWEKDQLEAPANTCQGCLRFRFPEFIRPVLRLVCLALVCFLSIVVLLYGVKFDLNPSFFCDNAQGARSWLLTFLVVTMVDVLVSRPLKLVLLHSFKFYVKTGRHAPAAVQLESCSKKSREPELKDNPSTHFPFDQCSSKARICFFED